ncbi:MAG: hypothetical protein Q3M24_21575 [Candidatus Electrothrix aestuarii]|uniref:Uncharacterized protein n=1 Tax=Candidatus Electrothrix aestuarii TaxID=3062594 RepID=A0AAU8LUF1_9BACT|nr:hypothetical protein [Candidatus Electrothrix aestuarii]
MAESTYVGNGLVEAGSDSGETARGEMDLGGWTDVGSGITVSNDSIVGVRSSDADPE